MQDPQDNPLPNSGQPSSPYDPAEGIGVRSAGVKEDLRDLRVLVLHPRDADGETIIRTVRRLNCQVQNLWHPYLHLKDHFDVALFLANEEAYTQVANLMDRTQTALIAIVGGGGADINRLLAEASPHAALSKPVRAEDVLTSIFIARRLLRYEHRLLAKVHKLEETLRSVRTVEKAKRILMKTNRLSERDAYELLRKSAMDRRLPIGQVASAVVSANGILSV
jgi:AmiR/NasT family two-component response regulator